MCGVLVSFACEQPIVNPLDIRPEKYYNDPVSYKTQMNSQIIDYTYQLSFTPEESSCICDLAMDYDQGILSVSFHSSPDKVYFYDVKDSSVFECLEEASKDLERFSIGKIFNYYITDESIVPIV